MRTYNVKQISDMLNTNPETVRRWIRSGKLKAVQDSRKEGNIVSDDMLKLFLKKYPKYAALVASPLEAAVVGAVIGTAGLISKYVIDSDKIKNSIIDADEVKKVILSEISTISDRIKQKENSISQLQDEIKSEKIKIEQLQALIKEIE